MLRDLLLKNRTYRRFIEEPVSQQTLETLVELARFTPSSANVQGLKFKLVWTKEECEKVFPTLSWAGYLKDWPGPEKGERPSAYIVILCDGTLSKNMQKDDGIAALAMTLGAVERGYGCCIIGSIDRTALAQELVIDSQRYTIDLVIALGKPKEEVCIEDAKDGEIRYYRDAQRVHHVPKRPLDELILK